MPTKSRSRRALEQLLADADDPARKAELAAQLARVIHQEGVERGRRRRAKAAKAGPKPKPVFDPDEEFDTSWMLPAQPPTPQTPPAAPAPPPAEPDEDETDAHERDEIYRQNGFGESYQVPSAQPLESWDYEQGGYRPTVGARPSCGMFLSNGEWNPFMVSDETVVADTYLVGQGWKSEIEHNERTAEAARIADAANKLSGRSPW